MSAYIEIAKKGNRLQFTNNKDLKLKPNPMHYLEAAIASCLGKCIREYEKKNNSYDDFTNIKVVFSNKTIRLSCEVKNKEHTKVFHQLVEECYILKHLSMDRNISVKEL